jgi:hypothetical protein
MSTMPESHANVKATPFPQASRDLCDLCWEAGEGVQMRHPDGSAWVCVECLKAFGTEEPEGGPGVPKAETVALDPDSTADAATVALFKAIWGPEGSPEAQEAALALSVALAAQEGHQGPSAASSDNSPPDADSRDWWAAETREDGESCLAGDMTETERYSIPATDYHGLFDAPPTYGPADGADSARPGDFGGRVG